MKIIDAEMGTIRVCDTDVYHMKRFIQSELPLLIHYQMCEGLDVLSGQFLPQLKNFEMKKLDELLNHNMDCAGKGIYIGEYGERIRDYGYHMKDTNRGFFPFFFGRGNDYWPGVTPTSTYKYSSRKEQWNNSRGKVNEKTTLENKNDLYEDMT